MMDDVPQRLVDRTQSYADGINAYIDYVQGPGFAEMPGEFVALQALPIEHWTSLDSARVGIFLARTVPRATAASFGTRSRSPTPARRPSSASFRSAPRASCRPCPAPRASSPPSPAAPGADLRKGFRKSQKFLAKQDLASVVDTIAGDPARRGGGEHRAPTSPAQACAASFPAPAARSCGRCRTRDRRAAPTSTTARSSASRSPSSSSSSSSTRPSSPSIHGVSAAGVPLIGIGHNGDVAWGFTSGLSDEDDLYVEKVTGPETYRFKGEERAMDCRDEVFTWKTPPTDLPGTLTGLIEGGG